MKDMEDCGQISALSKIFNSFSHECYDLMTSGMKLN